MKYRVIVQPTNHTCRYEIEAMDESDVVQILDEEHNIEPHQIISITSYQDIIDLLIWVVVDSDIMDFSYRRLHDVIKEKLSILLSREEFNVFVRRTIEYAID